MQVRAALEASGLDHGPISVHDKMHAMGLDPVPSIASLARIFRQAGVARLEPKKKPRSAWRRFVYPAPNACWQLDATEYVLSGGRKCVIFQLIDDHSRSRSPPTSRGARPPRPRSRCSTRPWPPTACRNGCCPTTASRSIPRGADSSASSSDTCRAWASKRSPASPTSRPPRARTNASTRPCSATSTSSHWPTHWPSFRPRSTRSTTSTTPSAPTRDYPAASHRGVGGHREGRGPRPNPSALCRPSRRATAWPAPPPTDLPAGTTVRS